MISSSGLRKLIFDNMRQVPRVHKTPTEAGIILHKDKSYVSIRINNTWYIIKNQVTLFQMISAAINPKELKEITYKLKKAIVLARNANSYNEVKDVKLCKRMTTNSFSFSKQTFLNGF